MENGTEPTVGEYLKSVREARGLTLDEASRVTKVGKNYLVAIEEGEFGKLPNAAYIKGFLRLYAGFLSLSGDQVVQRYEQGLPEPQRPQTEQKPERPGFEIMEMAKLGGHGRWILPALLLALVVTAAFFLSDQDQQPVRRPQPSAAPAVLPQVKPATAAQPRLSSAAGKIPQAVVKPEPLPQVLPPAVAPGEKPPAGVILRLHFTRDSWLSITIDDAISQRYELKAGDIIEWKGTRLFVLDVGDGGAVDGEFNGRALKSLGESGKPAHVELKGDQPKE